MGGFRAGRLVVLIGLLLAVAVVTSGCGGAAKTSAAAPIKIGLVTSVTGPLAGYGAQEIQGFKGCVKFR